MKIGGACKWLDPTTGDTVPEANFKGVTVRRLKELPVKERFTCLWFVLDHNLKALRMQLEHVAALPSALHMWRLSSELLPVATHEVASAFYAESEVQDLITKRLAWCGKFARKHSLRLSFHPGQFVVLGSRNPGIRENSARELEYHCEIFERMGYTEWHQDGLAVNVHVGLKDPELKAMLKYLKTAPKCVKNFVTLENDEFSWGAERIVQVFGEHVPLVLDVHHYWIHEGKRLSPNSPFVSDIRRTWRGVQPKLHLAMSAPELCASKPTQKLDLANLIDAGNTKAKLRVHSLSPWHTWSIKYAAQFGFDIMWEGKDKNVGAMSIANYLRLI
jgi:UV DNA damage endonuclease